MSLGVVHIHDVTVVRSGGQVFCDNITKAIVVKSVTTEGGRLKIVQNYMASFMDDPSFSRCFRATNTQKEKCGRTGE